MKSYFVWTEQFLIREYIKKQIFYSIALLSFFFLLLTEITMAMIIASISESTIRQIPIIWVVVSVPLFKKLCFAQPILSSPSTRYSILQTPSFVSRMVMLVPLSKVSVSSVSAASLYTIVSARVLALLTVTLSIAVSYSVPTTVRLST